MEEENTVIDVADKFMWNAVTFSYLQSNLKPGITYLDLTTNHVSFDSAIFIAKFISEKDSTLVGLSLVQTHLTTRAAKVIFEAVGNSNLVEFYADNNIFVQEACEVLGEALKKGPPLEVLSLCGCNIPSEGGIAIANSLPMLKNLEHLRLESNSLFDPGCQAVAKALKETSITHLSLADNEIWLDGTKTLFSEISIAKRIVSLDISYNTVDLDFLSSCLAANPQLTELSISGCKVREDLIANFLERLPTTHLKILIADGFDYNVLPISWPKVQDKTFSQQVYFEMLVRGVIESNTLEDIRVGFMEPNQIASIPNMFKKAGVTREVIFSLHDFGRTGNCWTIKMPEFAIEAPCDTLKWQQDINDEGAKHFGAIYDAASFNGEKLANIDVSNCNMTDKACIMFLQHFHDVNLNYLDLDTNKFGDSIIDHLNDMLTTCYVRDLRLEKTTLTDSGLTRLIRFFYSSTDRCPKELSFTVLSEDKDQLAVHQTFIELSKLIRKVPIIESFCLDGVITARDIKLIIDEMPGHKEVRELNFDTDLMTEYSSPDPPIDEGVTAAFTEMSKSLHTFITTEPCGLKDFKFPLYTEIFIYCNHAMMEQWHEVERKLEENNAASAE